MKLATFQDVVDQVLPLAPTMSERDVADLIDTIRTDPSAGPELLAAYVAADATGDGPTVLQRIWQILQTAAAIAGVVTSIGGAVAMVP